MKKKQIRLLPILILTVIILVLMLFMVIKTDWQNKSAADGLRLIGTVLIPSLYPFSCLVFIFNQSKAKPFLAGILRPFSRRILGCDPEILLLFFFSLLGGYPIGAMVLSESYRSKSVSSQDAKKILTFTVNPSPTFLVTVIGLAVFRSQAIGWMLLAANTLSALPFFLINARSCHLDCSKEKPSDLADAITGGITAATKSMLAIAGIVLFFMPLSSLIMPYFTDRAKPYFSLLFEITSGLRAGISCGVIFTGFAVSFGGLSVLIQILSFTGVFRPGFIKLFFTQLIRGSLTALIMAILLKLFPESLPVSLNMNYAPQMATGAVASFSLLVLAVVMMGYLAIVNKSFRYQEK